MGFFLRKFINYGPVRVNFSKSGIGVSVGVPGLRIGTGPNGNYLNIGVGGLGYKRKLPSLGLVKKVFKR